jgi:hypothetical protein
MSLNFISSFLGNKKIARKENPYHDADLYYEIDSRSSKGGDRFNFFPAMRHRRYLGHAETSPNLFVLKAWAESIGVPNFSELMEKARNEEHFIYISPKDKNATALLSDDAKLIFAYIYGVYAAIDAIEIKGVNPSKRIFQPSYIGNSVTKAWRETDPKSYEKVMERNNVSVNEIIEGPSSIDIESNDRESMSVVARTWLTACQLDTLYCAGPKHLPNIFATDQNSINKLMPMDDVRFKDGTILSRPCKTPRTRMNASFFDVFGAPILPRNVNR